MNINSVYKSDWLRAADLDGKPLTLTIASVGMSQFDDGRDQIVLEFEESKQKFGVNKTNARTISENLKMGLETDAWIGRRVTLYPTRVEFQGKRVDAIRVDDRVPF